MSDSNDPIAAKTRWAHISSVTGNFETRRLVKVNKDILAYKMSYGMRAFCTVFILVPYALIAAFLLTEDISSYSTLWKMFYVPCGAFFLFVGPALTIIYGKQIIIDKKEHKIKLAKLFVLGPNEIPFSKIHALQLIRTNCEDANYQINLVLKNADRVLLAEHCSQILCQNNANRLSKFLQIPIWDKTTE